MALLTNLGTAHIDATAEAAIDEAMGKLITALEPFMVNIEPKDRLCYGSINEQNKLFVNKVQLYSQTDKPLRSPEVDWDEFEKDFHDRAVLEKVIVTVTKVLSGLTGAKTLHDFDNFQAALEDYAYTKYRAGGKVLGFDAKNNELKQFFPKRSKAKKGEDDKDKKGKNPPKDPKKPKDDEGDDVHIPTT